MRFTHVRAFFVDQFAEYTEQAKEAILARDWDRLGDLMDANFALRRETYVQSICLNDG